MTNQLEFQNLKIKLKIATLWTSFMFLYIYVDYFHLYMTGSLSEIISGKMFVFPITQNALLIGLISVSIPSLMIFLSVILPKIINRWLNIIVALIYIPYSLFNLVGEVWMHMIFGAVVEILLLALIIRICFRWRMKDLQNELIS